MGRTEEDAYTTAAAVLPRGVFQYFAFPVRKEMYTFS